MGGGYSADKYLPKLGDHLFVIIDGSVKHYLDAQICVQLPLIRGHHTYMILHSPTQGTYLVKEKQGNGWLSARDSRTLLTWAHNHFTTENLANEELEQFVNTLLAQQEFQEEPEEWFFSSNALNQKIWTLQDEKTPYQICEIDPLRQEPVTALLHQCLKAMKNSRPLNMKKVFAIDNKQLYAAFSIQKDMMMRRWQASEGTVEVLHLS